VVVPLETKFTIINSSTYFNGFINEITSLITNKVGGTSKPSYNFFINEFSCVFIVLSLKALASTHLMV